MAYVIFLLVVQSTLFVMCVNHITKSQKRIADALEKLANKEDKESKIIVP